MLEDVRYRDTGLRVTIQLIQLDCDRSPNGRGEEGQARVPALRTAWLLRPAPSSRV